MTFFDAPTRAMGLSFLFLLLGLVATSLVEVVEASP
jgi:hypothetical protein